MVTNDVIVAAIVIACLCIATFLIVFLTSAKKIDSFKSKVENEEFVNYFCRGMSPQNIDKCHKVAADFIKLDDMHQRDTRDLRKMREQGMQNLNASIAAAAKRDREKSNAMYEKSRHELQELIDSKRACDSLHGRYYHYCPETGVHYCAGLCVGEAHCPGSPTTIQGACNAPKYTPEEIDSAAKCAAMNGKYYNYCPQTGIHYCDGPCKGRSTCPGTGLEWGACINT